MKSYLDRFLLKGKVAFVNGGVGLLGQEAVKALSDAGAFVVILDINKVGGLKFEKELIRKNKKVCFEFFDSTNLEDIDKKIKDLYKKYKRIDVWVNVSFPRTANWGEKVEDVDLNYWRKNVDIQLNSYSWVSRCVCLLMKKQKSGCLINFGSIYGVVGANFNIYEGTQMTSAFAYSAIKGGIVNLSRYLASYFGKYNVRINSVCPGGIFDNQDKLFVQNYSKQTPLKRMGLPSDVGGAVLFLASDAASYISGITLMVDGGWTAI